MNENVLTEPVQPRPYPDRQAVLRATALVPVTVGDMYAAHPDRPLTLAATSPVGVRTGGVAWDEEGRRLVSSPEPARVVGARIEILTVGEHPLGTAVKGPAAELSWPVWARLGDTPVRWHDRPELLPEGSRLPCYLNITGELRALLIQAEGEHGLDYNEALLRVAAPVADCLAQLPPGPGLDESLGRLVGLLVDRGARYLVPADPHDPAAWEPHLRRVYDALTAQARTRRDHPVRYEARIEQDPGAIVLSPVVPKGGLWLAAMDPAALDVPCYGGGAW